jgi:hypothetical protein
VSNNVPLIHLDSPSRTRQWVGWLCRVRRLGTAIAASPLGESESRPSHPHQRWAQHNHQTPSRIWPRLAANIKANARNSIENIKRDFHRHGRSQSFRVTSQNSMPQPANGRLHDEHTPLIGRTQNYANESRMKTFPKHVLHLVYATLASNYVNVFLVFVPLGIIAGALGWNSTAVFVLNFIAIIPLAALLSFATEELSAKLGQTLGGLMNATFGNAVELIVSLRARMYCDTTNH